VSTVRRVTMLAVITAAFGLVGLSDAPAQTKTKPAPAAKDKPADPPAATTALTFEIYKDAGGKFRWRLKDGDTNLGGAPKGYESKADVQKVIDTIKAGAAKAKVDDTAK
jgi:uncharacterized protein YegP (UPF0339 family)